MTDPEAAMTDPKDAVDPVSGPSPGRGPTYVLPDVRGMTPNQRETNIRERYPHYDMYKACQISSYRLGIFSAISGMAAVYITQELIERHLMKGNPIVQSMRWKKTRLLVPILIGCGISYVLTYSRMMNCQKIWIDTEMSHRNAQTPQSETTLEFPGENLVPFESGTQSTGIDLGALGTFGGQSTSSS